VLRFLPYDIYHFELINCLISASRDCRYLLFARRLERGHFGEPLVLGFTAASPPRAARVGGGFRMGGRKLLSG